MAEKPIAPFPKISTEKLLTTGQIEKKPVCSFLLNDGDKGFQILTDLATELHHRFAVFWKN
jgi:hypothetical protein